MYQKNFYIDTIDWAREGMNIDDFRGNETTF